MHRPDQFIPELIVRGGLAALDFYKSVLGAEEVHRMLKPGTDKLMHGELTLDGHKFFVCDEFPASEGGTCKSPESLGGTGVRITLLVDDADLDPRVRPAARPEQVRKLVRVVVARLELRDGETVGDGRQHKHVAAAIQGLRLIAGNASDKFDVGWGGGHRGIGNTNAAGDGETDVAGGQFAGGGEEVLDSFAQNHRADPKHMQRRQKIGRRTSLEVVMELERQRYHDNLFTGHTLLNQGSLGPRRIHHDH